jgi:MFS superfamily sulfate permease-like transporter
MLQFLRMLALILLIVVGVAQPKVLQFSLQKEWQYILSVAILVTLLFIDSVTGFIFALILVTIYIKIYDVKVPKLIQKNVYSEDTLDFITPTHLREAQSNVVNDASYKTDYKGIKGVYGEQVYGAQGLDPTLTQGYSSFEDYTQD